MTFKTLIYPEPDYSCPLPEFKAGVDQALHLSASGHDEFAGFRPYRETDSPGQVDWKGYARSGDLFTKQFENPIGGDILLSYQQAPGRDIESKLSVLAGWCINCEHQRTPYGLQVGEKYFSASLGQAHLIQCMEALALFHAEGK